MTDDNKELDFFAEAEKEINNGKDVENNKQADSSSKSNRSEYDDVWDSDKNIDELLQEQSNSLQTEDNKNLSNVQEPTVQEQKQIVVTKPLKYRGNEIWVKTEDELIELAQKGMDYSLKMNKIKPYRNLIAELENSNVDENDLLDFIKALSGSEEAKVKVQSKLMLDINKEPNVLIGEDNEDNGIKQQVNNESFIDSIMNELASYDMEKYGKVANTMKKAEASFIGEVTQSEELFRNFIGSVLSGEFDKVYPYAVKEKTLNPHLNWINAYVSAFKKLENNEFSKSEEPSDALQTDVKSKSSNNRKSIKEQYDEIWDNEHSIEELESMLVQEI
jgi:hypothetical protein